MSPEPSSSWATWTYIQAAFRGGLYDRERLPDLGVPPLHSFVGLPSLGTGPSPLLTMVDPSHFLSPGRGMSTHLLALVTEHFVEA